MSDPTEKLISALMRLCILAPQSRLIVHMQNPADNYYWSKPLSGVVTAEDLLTALTKTD